MRRRKLPNKQASLPLCSVPVSPNVDIGVIRHVKTCNELSIECARWLRNARGDDAAAEAQRTLLLNLQACLGEAVFGMLVLLNHGADYAVLILERGTIEYYARASYYMKEPEHALWTVEVERLQVELDNEGTAGQQRSALIDGSRKRGGVCAHLTPEARLAAGKEPFHKVRILEMIRVGLGDEAAKMNGSASLALHGDLYTGRIVGWHAWRGSRQRCGARGCIGNRRVLQPDAFVAAPPAEGVGRVRAARRRGDRTARQAVRQRLPHLGRSYRGFVGWRRHRKPRVAVRDGAQATHTTRTRGEDANSSMFTWDPALGNIAQYDFSSAKHGGGYYDLAFEGNKA